MQWVNVVLPEADSPTRPKHSSFCKTSGCRFPQAAGFATRREAGAADSGK